MPVDFRASAKHRMPFFLRSGIGLAPFHASGIVYPCPMGFAILAMVLVANLASTHFLSADIARGHLAILVLLRDRCCRGRPGW